MGHFSRTTPAPLIHVRVHGRSQDVPLEELNLAPDASPTDIRRAVGEWMRLSDRDVDALQLDRCPNGNLILRPVAVFG